MKILMANDDGISALGLKTLANALARSGHNVLVVAPSGNRSGFSHSLTVKKPLKFFRYHEGYDARVEAYSLDATPADCMKFACYHFAQFNPDVVVTGINEGPNLAVDTMYSGTVGSAMEGASHGFKAVAVSLACYYDPKNFETAASVLLDNLDDCVKSDEAVVWNINCPDVSYNELRGVKFTRLGKLNYDETYELTQIEHDDCYTLGGEPLEEQSKDIETDVGAVLEGYVSITPILIDRTDFSVLNKLNK